MRRVPSGPSAACCGAEPAPRQWSMPRDAVGAKPSPGTRSGASATRTWSPVAGAAATISPSGLKMALSPEKRVPRSAPQVLAEILDQPPEPCQVVA